MPLDVPTTGINDRPSKVEPVECNCDLLWSLAHEFSYLRLADAEGDNTYRLVDLYAARARRIAATYARFYLELEEGGETSKLGRHYWMALGAFASKTVACLLTSWQLEASYTLWMTKTANGLGQGNLWLYSDVSASHWLYNNYREHFHEGMACETRRDAQTLEEDVKATVLDLPWAEPSLSRISHFRPSAEIQAAFRFTVRIELALSGGNRRSVRELQFKHLFKVAEHEQGAVLQPLIYDDPDFAAWTRFDRNWTWWLSPTYQLSFHRSCEVDDPELKSVAPDDVIIEDYDSRMAWIEAAARKFHGLMRKRPAYMRAELEAIAGWVDAPDALLVW